MGACHGGQASTGSTGSERNVALHGGHEADARTIGTDIAFRKHWFWGHADSTVEPPQDAPSIFLQGLSFVANLSHYKEYYRDFLQLALCPNFIDYRAKQEGASGCPFLGGRAFVRHEDVKARLEAVPEELCQGTATRKNELGYFMLSKDAFPGVERGESVPAVHGTIGLGASLEEHRIQREWLEYLLDPNRLPHLTRDFWLREVRAFLSNTASKGKGLKIKHDVARWWQIALWKQLLAVDLEMQDADEMVDLGMAWLQSANLPFPNNTIDHLGEWAQTDTLWKMEKVHQVQKKFRDKILDALATLPREIPAADRALVAQGVLEMFCFAGGLSVPATVQAAICVLYAPDLLPSPEITERNVEAYVYEVTRLFPAVQGFCYWKDEQRQILSLNAALRDPAVWGPQEAHKFTLKDPALYRANHVGFANFARASSSSSSCQRFDARNCPAQQLALDVVQAWVLAFSEWEKPGTVRTGSESQNTTDRRSSKATAAEVRTFWMPEALPTAKKVPAWWGSLKFNCQDWLDGDQTGEDFLALRCPVEVARLLGPGTGEVSKTTLQHLGLVGRGVTDNASRKLALMSLDTMVFYEVAKSEFRSLSKHQDASKIDTSPAKPHKEYFLLDFGIDEGVIKLPIPGGFEKVARQRLISVYHNLLKGFGMPDKLHDSLRVSTKDERSVAIATCQELFAKKEKEGDKPPPNSTARADSYLPKPMYPFGDLTLDDMQVAVARCGMGQLFLKVNRDPRLQDYGDVLCDVTALHAFPVREAFERLGAAAVFRRAGTRWQLTAIDWKHGGKVVLPGSSEWEHAKWVWRSSLSTYVTAVCHLMWNHWIVSNSFSTSIRETLDPDHPIRRVLMVHSYNTPKVNYRSAMILWPEFGALHRMSAFPIESLREIFKVAANMYKFQTWPQFYDAMDLQQEEKQRLPIFEDGLQYYHVLHEFYSNYVNLFYPNDSDVQNDPQLPSYWKFQGVPQFAKAVPPLSKATLVDHLTQAVFDVTAYHEFVGGMVNYTTDPAGVGMQVRPGADMADMQHHTALNSLVASTGTPMPMLIPSNQEGDKSWLPMLLRDEKGSANEKARNTLLNTLYEKLMKDLKKVSADVETRNESGQREHPFAKFDPLLFERSVSL